MSRTVSEPRSRRASKAPPEPDALEAQASNATTVEPAQAAATQPADGGQQPPREPRTYELGILFIHGMGEQATGDTISQMGDAVTEWVDTPCWRRISTPGHHQFSTGHPSVAERTEGIGEMGRRVRQASHDPEGVLYAAVLSSGRVTGRHSANSMTR